MRWYSYILVFLFFVFQGQLWFSSGGVFDLIKTKKTLVSTNGKLAQLKIENQKIISDISDLKSGHSSVEERAREVLGMVQKNEVFYQVLLPI
jgi:cell division protein FtsB